MFYNSLKRIRQDKGRFRLPYENTGGIDMLRAADYRERARASLRNNWGMAVLVCFLGMLLGGISTGSAVTVNYSLDDGPSISIMGVDSSTGHLSTDLSDYLTPGVLGLLTMATMILVVFALIKFVIGGAVELGICAYFSKLALGMPADLNDEFAYFKYFGKALGLRVVMYVFIFLWTLLFLIPGLIATYRYAMAPYILAEHPEMGIMEAIDASKQMMDGNKWSLFCLEISFIGWTLLSSLTLGIGDLFLTPYMKMATAHFYMNLSRGSASNQNMGNM